ncbi:hypothetical protein E3J74_02330 [Candidatus Bathyarchaeota archaeon]|nr:MAG: hypothetical protein E3J74_02330 [Candidatus Bathyarchaeota archaeon]
MKYEMKVLCAVIAVAFVLVGLFVGLGVIPPVNEGEGLLTNLLKGGELWYENPMLIGVIVGLIVNIFGYVENLSRDRGIEYDFGRLAETWLFYEPMLILASQALPMGEAVIVAVVIDVVRRAIKAHGKKA